VQCRDVRKEFGEGNSTVVALRGVDLQVRLGEMAFLVGPSGSGKTTLLSVIAGLLDSTSGEVEVLGERVEKWPNRRRILFRRKNLGFVFQQYNLLPALTAAENVAVPRRIRAGRPTCEPLILFGNVDVLNVRTDVDEHDAWKVSGGAAAYASVRGNSDLRVPLQFVRFEPYIVPKKSLTGDSTERVDTRVLQVLYSFNRDTLPVYAGQQMDVFIEATLPTGLEAGSDWPQRYRHAQGGIPR
jgi:ABC-type sugar transport system ATPase subunit